MYFLLFFKQQQLHVLHLILYLMGKQWVELTSYFLEILWVMFVMKNTFWLETLWTRAKKGLITIVLIGNWAK